jgi:hypothetical protein
MLPWVDKCFGTFYLPMKQWPMKYGIDVPLAPGLARQLLHPFAWHYPLRPVAATGRSLATVGSKDGGWVWLGVAARKTSPTKRSTRRN